MTNDKQIDEAVSRTLELLKPGKRVQCSPGLQSRVMACTRNLEQKRNQYGFRHSAGSVAAAVFAFLVICINTTSLIWVLNDTTTSTTTNQSYLTAVVEDYNRSSNSDYRVYLNHRIAP